MRIKEQQHITQLIILCLTVVLILPSVVKFSHVLSHHEHEVCVDTSASHFHEVDVDCEFYKFKLNTNYLHDFDYIDIIPNEFIHNSEYSYYAFIRSHKRNALAQRGPPSLS